MQTIANLNFNKLGPNMPYIYVEKKVLISSDFDLRFGLNEITLVFMQLLFENQNPNIDKMLRYCLKLLQQNDGNCLIR